ncbi:MAG: serine/threonine-protein kinase [Gemmatimonadaceae bacterium]
MPDSAAPSTNDTELRAHVERALRAHYELDMEIGRGGMGIVYLAKDTRLKRRVAIKVLPPELAFRSEIRSRFLREAETAASLSHQHIVPIYGVDEVEGLVFFAMAYVDGDNLAKLLHEKGVLPIEDVRRITREVAEALAYAHSRGVVHRDIKPDNVLLDKETGRAMVTDFGIARAMTDGADSRLTATGMAIGTPTYMSPEQAAGEREIDGRSDLYSLGILAYQMLCGEPPFNATSTPAMLVKHISERPTPVEQRRVDVPEDLARAVMLLLEKDPAMRFPSAAALVAALDGGEMPVGREGGPAASGLERRGELRAAASARTVSPRSPESLYSPRPEAPVPRSSYAEPTSAELTGYVPTPDEVRRWESHPVEQFRKKVAPYLFVNGVIVLFAIFSGSDIITVTVLWSIYIAYRYARLWSDGYDWRDVFRQPQDRELIDVFEEWVEGVKALFNPEKRRELKERRRDRALARPSGMRLGAGASPASGYPGSYGAGVRPSSGAMLPPAEADRVRRAQSDRDEILRLVDALPAPARAQLPDVKRSAIALSDKVEELAIAMAMIERDRVAGGLEAVDAEIDRLEAAANPLEPGSEDRVRRLSFLRRQRRAILELDKRRQVVADKLETCVAALQNMKLDVLRLRAGAQTAHHVTSLAMNALHLAESVDGAVYAAHEAGRAQAR